MRMSFSNKIGKLYWIVWIASVLYGLWKFKKSAEENYFSLNNSDFEDGWMTINRPKDQSDFEWIVLRSTFKKFWPLLLIQVCLSEIVRRTCSNILPIFYAVYSIVSVTMIIGEKATLICTGFIVLSFAVHTFGRKLCCYALCICALVLKNSSYVSNTEVLMVGDEKQSFLFDVALTWIMAKSLSFMIDRINFGTHVRFNLRDFALVIAYCLYLPSVFTGPLLAYESFLEQINRPHHNSTLKYYLQKTKHLIYVLFWYFIHEVMLHYIYSSSIQYYPHVVSNFDSWSLCGLGYALPAMFFLKYFVIYSLAQSVASFEDFELPPPPKCISCIHMSTYLWRTFDKGLYLWILKYLYHPLMQGQKNVIRKLFALASSFGFVCLWHNVDKAICVWTFLNFILVSSETFVQIVSSARRWPRIFDKKSFCALFATPHFILMCLSSTFFLSNYEIGVLLLNRVLFTGLIPFVPVFLIMYCGCLVSSDVREWERNRQCSYSYITQKSLWRKR